MATTQRAPFHDARFAAKGGSAWLHQHVMNNYVYCWQQGLSNGEIDGAVCDIGTHLRMVSIMIPHQIYHDQKSGLTEIHMATFCDAGTGGTDDAEQVPHGGSTTTWRGYAALSPGRPTW
jgi:hypothetical protein